MTWPRSVMPMPPGSLRTAQAHAQQKQLTTQDLQHTKVLSDAQRNQARLRDQLAIADVQLVVSFPHGFNQWLK